MFEVWQEGNAVYVTNVVKQRWMIEDGQLVLTIREANELASLLATKGHVTDSIEMEKEWEDA